MFRFTPVNLHVPKEGVLKRGCSRGIGQLIGQSYTIYHMCKEDLVTSRVCLFCWHCET